MALARSRRMRWSTRRTLSGSKPEPYGTATPTSAAPADSHAVAVSGIPVGPARGKARGRPTARLPCRHQRSSVCHIIPALLPLGRRYSHHARTVTWEGPEHFGVTDELRSTGAVGARVEAVCRSVVDHLFAVARKVRACDGRGGVRRNAMVWVGFACAAGVPYGADAEDGSERSAVAPVPPSTPLAPVLPPVLPALPFSLLYSLPSVCPFDPPRTR